MKMQTMKEKNITAEEGGRKKGNIIAGCDSCDRTDPYSAYQAFKIV